MQKLFVIFALIAKAFTAEWDNGVLVITDQNFEEERAKYDNLLIEFYAPWCGHCKKLAPEYEAAAQELAQNDPPLYIAKCDATENTKLKSKHGITGFPNVQFLKADGKNDVFKGRKQKDIVDYVKKNSLPPSTETTCDVVKAKLEYNKSFISVYFGSKDDAYYRNVHSAFFDGLDFQLLHTDDEACAKEYGASYPGEVLFKTFDDKIVPYTGKQDKVSAKTWAYMNMFPSVFEFNAESVEIIFGQNLNLFHLFRSGDDATADFMNTFTDAAVANKGKGMFTYSDVSGDMSSKLAQMFSLTASDLPALVSVTPNNMHKFISSDKASALTVASITKFADDVVAGALEPLLLSDPVPANNDGAVKEVVGTTFEKIVMDSTKDVLVAFYAPWSQESIDFMGENILSQIAKEFKNVVVTQFDASTNEVQGLHFRGYPSFKIYPKNNKAVTYSGEETDFDSIKEFVQQTIGGVHDEL